MASAGVPEPKAILIGSLSFSLFWFAAFQALSFISFKPAQWSGRPREITRDGTGSSYAGT